MKDIIVPIVILGFIVVIGGFITWDISLKIYNHDQRVPYYTAVNNSCLQIRNDIIDGKDIHVDIINSIKAMTDISQFYNALDISDYQTGLNLVEAISIMNEKTPDPNKVPRTEMIKLFNEFIPKIDGVCED